MHKQALAVTYLIIHPCIGFSTFYLLFWSSFSRISSQENYLYAVFILYFAFEEDSQSKQNQFSVFAERPIQ